MTAISDLDIFARVARTGNMSAAGREMSLSPAVVSKRISLLEERLGARLFQRTTRQLTLTETGEGYFKRVVDILSLVEEAEDYVSRRNTKPRGNLKISVPTSFNCKHIAPHLPAFFAKYPDIELDVHLSDHYVDIIREGFDVAIRIGELEDSSLVARKLADENRIMCASPLYLARAGTPAKLEDLDAHNCLLAGAQDIWRLEGPDGEHDIRVKGNIRSNSADFVRTALVQGLGIALRGVWDVGPEIERGELVVVLPDYRGSSNNGIYAVYSCREFMPSKVNAFIEYLAELYANDAQWDHLSPEAIKNATALERPLRRIGKAGRS
ncbi:MAG: LysR family transcriptional regulator [Hyphomicrobium sp.]